MNLPEPHQPVTDADREVLVAQVQRAMANGHVRFEELDDRFEAIYRATTHGELEALRAKLPGPPPPATPAPVHPLAPVTYSLFGDVKVAVGFPLLATSPTAQDSATCSSISPRPDSSRTARSGSGPSLAT